MGLNEDHSYLYKRVRLKAILHTALGLALIFLPSNIPVNTRGTVSGQVAALLSFLGCIYLVIGGLIVVGLFKSSQTYHFLRRVMTIAAIYSTFWCMIYLAILIDQPNRNTAYVAIIYFYLTYNLWYVRNDPGWSAIQIVKEITHDGNDKRITK